MKKLSILFIAFILILSSCSSDDDGGGQVTGDIVGTWVGTDLSLSGEIETTIEGQTIMSTITGEGYDLTNKLTFTESPNLISSEGKVNMKLTVTINGLTFTENEEDFEFLGDGTWEINGNDLIIKDPDEEIIEDELREVTIFKLTDNELIIKITETDEDMEEGETSTIEILASFIRE